MQFFQQKALQTLHQLMLRGIDSSLCQELPQPCVFNIESKLFFTGQYADPAPSHTIQSLSTTS